MLLFEVLPFLKDISLLLIFLSFYKFLSYDRFLTGTWLLDWVTRSPELSDAEDFFLLTMLTVRLGALIVS